VGGAEGLEAYCGHLPKLVAASGARLVVVDSIAALLRSDLGTSSDAPERSRLLFSIAGSLQRLSAETGCGVLVTNQASDVLLEDGAGGVGGGGAAAGSSSALSAAAAAGLRVIPRRCAALSSGRWVRPALGPSWDSCVTHRLLLTHHRGAGSSSSRAPEALLQQAGEGGERVMYLISSPLLPPRGLSFTVDGAAGVRGLGEPFALGEG